jgi:tyrosinase
MPDFGADKCHYGEHTYAYAYNLCDCMDCPKMPETAPPACTGDKACLAGPYDYRVHDIVANLTCSAHITKPEPLPTVMPPTCNNGEIMTTPPALAGGCQRCTCAGGQWQCACSLRHRKDINDFTDEEFNKFAAALNALKADGTWANISMVHSMGSRQRSWSTGLNAGNSHGSPVFLPWHRKYIVEVENRLQMAVDDCSVSMPYWNWALQLADFEDSKVFSSNRMGALRSDADDMCVTDGAFGTKTAGSSFGYGPNELGEVTSRTDCIMRKGRAPWSGQSYTTILTQLQQQYMGTDDFVDMSNYIERNLHNGFHYSVGGWGSDSLGNRLSGHMTGYNSPYDPMFFMHHGFMDFLWYKWQSVHVDESNRLHRQGDLMYGLLWDGQHDAFPVSDVAWNLDILDDKPDTEDVEEKACVVYHDTHHGDHACAAEWNRIQACISKVVKAQRLHEVPRIKEMLSEGDICSPVNDVHTDFDRRWLETMAAMGMLDKSAIPDIMKWESTMNTDIEERTPTLPEADASECDKKLCFSTAKLFEICDEI